MMGVMHLPGNFRLSGGVQTSDRFTEVLTLAAGSVITVMLLGAVAVVQTYRTPHAPLTSQPLPRSIVASPDIHRVVAESAQHKLIEVVWKPGQRDALHSQWTSAVVYLTDCRLRIHASNGVVREVNQKAGNAVVQAHVVENIGSADCKLVIFEPA